MVDSDPKTLNTFIMHQLVPWLNAGRCRAKCFIWGLLPYVATLTLSRYIDCDHEGTSKFVIRSELDMFFKLKMYDSTEASLRNTI